MKSLGKVLLDRNFLEWCEKELNFDFSQTYYLLWLFLNTTYDKRNGIAEYDSPEGKKQISYELNKGEFYFSLSFLKEAWKMKNNTEVSRFLQKLVNKGILSSRVLYSYKRKKNGKEEVVKSLIYKIIDWENSQKFNNKADAIASAIASDTDNQQLIICDVIASANNYTKNNNKDLQRKMETENFSKENEIDSFDNLDDNTLSILEEYNTIKEEDYNPLVFTSKYDLDSSINNIVSYSLENTSLEYPDKTTFILYCKNKLGFNKDDSYLETNYDRLSKSNWKTDNTPIINWKSYIEKVIVKNYNPSLYKDYSKKTTTTTTTTSTNNTSLYLKEINGKQCKCFKKNGKEFVYENGMCTPLDIYQQAV